MNEAGGAPREGAIAEFLAHAGWAKAARAPLAGDASFRRYWRLRDGGRRAVLMDMPPEKLAIAPFLLVDAHLRDLGYSAPEILAADPAAGLALLEDLGDDSFAASIDSGREREALYALAIDLLIDLHRRGRAAIPPGLPAYDDARMVEEAGRFLLWYVPAQLGSRLPDAAEEEFAALWPPLLAQARRLPETMVLRDYHPENLHRLARPGLAACGLLDFQDAVAGPVTYDLASLLEDARRDVDADLAASMRARYLAAFPALDRVAFADSWAILAAQRHVKCLGLFVRLARRDGKPAYLAHIPRLWRMLAPHLAHPALAPLARWLDRHLPAPLRGSPPP